MASVLRKSIGRLRRLCLLLRHGAGRPADMDLAHGHSLRNRQEVQASELCGCFYCLSVFTPGQIQAWVPDEDTALCPYCGIDSVIGSQSSYPINRRFLIHMHLRWF